MIQIFAIFYDAYRRLNARKMFWFVLVLSVLVVAVFGAVHINEKGIKVAIWQIDNDILNTQFFPIAYFYKFLFLNIGIKYWLSWLAIILALVSTAGIFPDLIAEGSIDLLVSKPISRLKLFFTQYAAGLLFVTLQVTLFSLAGFLVIGLRGGVWEPGLFLAVPLVVCMFSYLFSVCVFLGVLTRSTVASLLLTIFFWFVIYGLGAAEQQLLFISNIQQQSQSTSTSGSSYRNEYSPPNRSSEDISQSQQNPDPQTGDDQDPSGESNNDISSLETAHSILYGMKTVLPKTTETIDLLERNLISLAELPDRSNEPGGRRMQVLQQQEEILRSRSITWVIGTSLIFELLILAAAALIFCRRDY